MHRCLAIEEVLRVIFEFAAYVDPFGDPSQLGGQNLSKGYQADLRTLFYIALTCKAFENPALDRLWRRQWGLENLVALLPKGQTGLFEAITGQDWARFDIYARRVKQLDVNKNYLAPVFSAPRPSRAILETLRAHAKPILSSLEQFDWSSTVVSDELLAHFDIFLGPTVTNFSLDTRDVPQAPEAESKVSVLPSMSPVLEHLRLSAQGTLHLVSQLPRIVSSLPRLKSFACRFVNVPLSVQLLLALSAHPRLERLELCVGLNPERHPIVEQESPPTAAMQVTFSKLQHLVLGITTAVLCAEALKGMKLPALEGIRLEMTSTIGFRDALVGINTSCSPSALKILYMHNYNGDMEGPMFMTRDDLAILQKFKGLTTLTIDCPFNLTDDDLKTIATWWPHLEILSLGQDGWIGAPRVTLVGLLELVKGCPHLTDLDLAFNPMQPADFDPQGHCNERITWLGVSDSPVEGDPQVIADRLKALFPLLHTISPSESDTEAQIEWDQVQLSL